MQNNLPQSNPIDPIVGSQIPVSGPVPAPDPVQLPVDQPVTPTAPVNPAPVPIDIISEPAPLDLSSGPAPLDLTPEPASPGVTVTPEPASPESTQETVAPAAPIEPPAAIEEIKEEIPVAKIEPVIEPVVEPVAPPINIDIPADVAPAPAQTEQEAAETQMHTNAASLNVLSDIIPEPTAKMPEPAPPMEVPIDQTSQTTTNNELSQVFQMVPSDVSIPSGPAPVSTGDEPVMISTDQFMAQMQGNETPPAAATPVMTQVTTQTVPTPIQTLSSTPEKIGQVNVAAVPQTGGKSGGFLRMLIWIFILILGVVAVLLGLYFANVLQLPFLNSIFGR